MRWPPWSTALPASLGPVPQVAGGLRAYQPTPAPPPPVAAVIHWKKVGSEAAKAAKVIELFSQADLEDAVLHVIGDVHESLTIAVGRLEGIALLRQMQA